jgi:hypothetical protein
MRSALALALLAACHHSGAGAPDARPADAPIDSPPQVDCSAPIDCPTAAAGAVTFCGTIVELADTRPLVDPAAAGRPCDPLAPTIGGPCGVVLTPYDAAYYASNPVTAQPLPAGEIVVDACGRYRMRDIQPQGAQTVALVLTDARTGAFEPTASVFAVLPSTTHPGTTLYAFSAVTDEIWTAALGLTGPSLGTQGGIIALFEHGDAPVAGVTITAAGATDATNDYYFNDATPGARTMPSSVLDRTGADGTAFLLGHYGDLTAYSGTGGEPAGCSWPIQAGVGILNVSWVEPFVARETGAPTMLCP